MSNHEDELKYTEKQFKKGLKTSYISINTEKGLAYLEAI